MMENDLPLSLFGVRCPVVGKAYSYMRRNPQLVLAAILFGAGVLALATNIAALAGALFGAGATLLGGWMTEFNNWRAATEEKSRRQSEARQYLAPELHRTILRVLYIHERAVVNFGSASAALEIKPNDLKEDFIPFWPILYPKAPQVHQLLEDEAMALIGFYDSLHALGDFVNGWWAREGQLEVNIFNMIRNNAGDSLKLALVCIQKFQLDRLYPPQVAGAGTLTSRIEKTLSMSAKAVEHHIAKFESKAPNTVGTASRRPR